MKLRIFQSYSGDCLLLESADKGHRILCDGGTPQAMRDYGAEGIAELQRAGKGIDLLYISHIDSDHIGGAAVLLENALEWQVWDYHAGNGDPPAVPELARPPTIKRIWHNGFRDMVSKNTGAIEKLLAASAPVLSTSTDVELQHRGQEMAKIATSISEALRVSRLVKPDLLGIELNSLKQTPTHSGKLVMARSDMKVEKVGNLNITVLCPTTKELRDLRNGWNNWLAKPASQKAVKAIRDMYASSLESGAVGGGMSPFDLFGWEGLPAYKGVTVPNIASLVLLVEEAGRSILLTGDNHADMILEGLRAQGRLDEGYCHVDVLKFPHHGATDNLTASFTQALSADHYVFCGDGTHSNPELEVLRRVYESRLGPMSKRVRTPDLDAKPFHFWFSTSSAMPNASKQTAHMKKVEAWAANAMAASNGIFKAHFSDSLYLDLEF